MSGLEIIHEKNDDPDAPAVFVVNERLCLTDDDRLVPEGHPDARWLFAVPGREIPFAEAVKYGLAKAKPESKPEPEVAPAAPPKRARPKGK